MPTDQDRTALEAGGDELRPITALFADIVGSTSLGERLPPDEIKALVGDCVTRMTRAVEEFGGLVQAYMGDGIAAYFGVPAAHEDDPERAARAGLRILEVVSEYAADIAQAWGIQDFNVRVGINSGETAVGLVGSSDPQAVALGDATNVAARLQSSAEPGTIAVGDSTARRLADRFALAPLGEVSVKGRTAPVVAWRLESARVPPRSTRPGEVFGRTDELARLTNLVEELASGRGQVLLMGGEAGIGKSRLLAELRELAPSGAVWLQGRCLSYGSGFTHWPLVEMLRDWLDVHDGEPEVVVRTKLRARLESLSGLPVDDVMAYLGRLLSVKLDSLLEARSADLPADMLSDHVRTAFVSWIEGLAQTGPVVVAVEDFQWADPATRDVVEHLLDVTDRAPVMIAITARVEPSSEGRPLRLRVLTDFAHRATDLTLGPLDEPAARAFADSLVPEGELDTAARDRIIGLAEGNPLYIEELMKSLLEGGGLVRERTWTLSVDSAEFLPPGIESLLVARIDRLPAAARRLAQIAAVVGRTFPVRVLAHVAGGAGETAEVSADIAVLLRAEIVREVSRYPDLQCTFKHGLLQEAALSTLTPTRRRDLYGRVAVAFEELFAATVEDHLELLAHLYYRSNDRPKALHYLARAAAKAEGLDPAEAARLRARADKVANRITGAAVVPAPDAPRPPHRAGAELSLDDRVGSYQIEEVLGEGATGRVYRAVRDDGTVVALKVLRSELTHDEVYRRRFLHEARAAGEVSHKHLLNILEAGDDDGLLYLAMPYVEGVSLKEMIDAQGSLPLAMVIRVAAQIGGALDALHGAGIVHRDVKPSNIMVDAEGTAALTDFGLAKGRAYTVLTRPGQVIGTLDYIAPEIIKGAEAGPLSDIYSFGCVVYQCLAGTPPFADKEIFQIGLAHMVDEPADPCAARDDVPADVCWTALQALAKDPERRPPTATAYANLLQIASRRGT